MKAPTQIFDHLLRKHLSPQSRATLLLRSFALMRVPLLAFTAPKVVQISESRCELVIPFVKRNKNHLNSLYFGAFTIGAEAVCGLLAIYLQEERGISPLDLQFKNFRAIFHKRAMANTHFYCDSGKEIASQIEQVLSSGERVNITYPVYAICPSIDPNEKVAEFELTLSLKKRN